MRYRPNPAFHSELEATPEFQAGERRIAVEVAKIVRAGAPRHSGAYKRSIRARGRLVVTTDAFWHVIEFGSVNNPPYAPFRRGVRAAGLRLDDARRPG